MNLTRGRKEPCKDNIGGIRELNLMTYVEHDVRAIVGYRNLLITSFPVTQVYKYEGQEKRFDETYNEDGYYEQELNIRLVKQDLSTSQLLLILSKSRVRATITDYLGKTRIAGLVNGLDAEIKAISGGQKSDFVGYEVRLTGLEELKAPYVESLEDLGLTQKPLDYGCLLASSGELSSISDLVSSCNSLASKSLTLDCLYASSAREASLGQLVSSCNIAV